MITFPIGWSYLGTKAINPVISELKDAEGPGQLELIRIIAWNGPDAEAAVGPLADLLNSPNGDIRRQALHALGQIGPKAKGLVGRMEKELKDDQEEVRFAAATAVLQIDPTHPAAAELLATYLKEDPRANMVSAAAWDILASLGRPAVPHFISNLTATTVETRQEAALRLGEIGPDAADAIEALCKALKDSDSSVRRFAVDALRAIDLTSPKVRCALIEALSDGDLNVIHSVAVALGDIGPDAKAAVPKLRKFVQNDRVRIAVVSALALIDPSESDAAVALLATDLLDEHFEDRIRGLAKMGSRAKAAVPALVKALKDPSLMQNLEEINPRRGLDIFKAMMPSLIIEALGRIGPDAEGALPALREMLEQPPVKVDAAVALALISEDEVESSVGLLTEALRDPGLQFHAIHALGDLGPKAKAAVPDLSALLKHRDPTVRDAVRKSLKMIERER